MEGDRSEGQRDGRTERWRDGGIKGSRDQGTKGQRAQSLRIQSVTAGNDAWWPWYKAAHIISGSREMNLDDQLTFFFLFRLRSNGWYQPHSAIRLGNTLMATSRGMFIW